VRKLALVAVSLSLAVAGGSALTQTSGRAAMPAQPPGTLTALAVGNTLQVDYANAEDHPRVVFKMKADGTFTSVFPGDVAGSGDFVADTRYVCFIVKTPAESHEDGANARCEANAAPGRSVGDTWTMTDSMGDEVSLTIKAGQ
jgi:membrane-bound inhibitor of C-type lysozyme